MTKPSDFCSLLESAWEASTSCLCVGVDPTADMIPSELDAGTGSLYEFGARIVDAVCKYVCSLKINHAHFAAAAEESQLVRLIQYIHTRHPSIPVILDAKRGDIGATAQQYAREAFERYEADAVTVNPYLGWTTIEPFLEYESRGVIVLCKTSNPDAAWLQDFPEENPMYLRVARRVQEASNPNIMLVVGATHPKALHRVRESAPDVTFLVPGIGAQGGIPADVLQNGRRQDGLGLIVNCSRSVISQNPNSSDYFGLVQKSARDYNRLLAHERH